MSVTSGFPFVIVPVLSSAICVTFPVISSDSDVLNSMPSLAPTPFPTIIATGVASPSAHGQLTTSTDMALSRAKPMSLPSSSQTAAVITAITSTTGTNTAATLSAILAIGALVAEASDTIFIICESVVSRPTRVALALMYPDVFRVAAETVSPSDLSTGMLSPVSADSSTAVVPSVITPSTGTFSPGRTAKMSPTAISSIGTVTSLPSTILHAVSGASFISDFKASVVRPLDIASSIFPTVMRVTIIAADSKYSPCSA